MNDAGEAAMIADVRSVVDPGPVIDERLRELAAGWEPRIAALERAATAPSSGVRKNAVRRALRAYRAARRRVVSRLGGSAITW